MKARNPAPSAAPECATLRLAQGDVATIDMCSCGTLRLNLGAITVRLTPDAMASLMQTVSEGVATHTALRKRPRFVAEALPSSASKVSREGAS